MACKDYNKIYLSMLNEFLNRRKRLLAEYKLIRKYGTLMTASFYEHEINICNKYISAINRSIKNEKLIDKL